MGQKFSKQEKTLKVKTFDLRTENSAEPWELASSVRICRSCPTLLTFSTGISEHDNEGRVITAEFEDFYLVTACK